VSELAARRFASAPALRGEVIDPRGLTARAAEVAARQRSPATRRTYAAVYRSFAAFVGPQATAEDLTPEAVRAYRDALERCGRSPATVAKHLSALRGLADGLGADQAMRTVRSARVARGEPRALEHDEWARLLRMPDRRSRQGKRDLALLHLLGSAGLRRAEAAGLLVSDVDERRRASDPRLREAIARSTSWWVTVRYGKRGRTRAIPLDEDALAAIAAWVTARPVAASEHLLLSLPRTGQPPRALSTRDVARIVARYAHAAGLPEDRRTPHVLRHTFCTHLADAGADVGVIRELAGHADIRTTTVYTAVNDERLQDAIAGRRRDRLRLEQLNAD
jgi:site-specific recombinase XerD